MSIIIDVTGGAVHRCAFEDAVLMATLAGNRGMLPVEMECKLGMIHSSRSPTSREMTGSTIRSQLTVVMVIFFVTGKTSLRRGFQVRQITRVNMAGRTLRKDMFPTQVECNFIVIKIRAA
jgi:hypothetical protein